MFYNRSGFTLIEILLAILIFSILATTLFSSFNTLTKQNELIGTVIYDYEVAKNCIYRISKDLESIYITNYPVYSCPEIDSEPDPYRIQGDTSLIDGIDFSKLRFTCFEHLCFENNTKKGIAEIVYYISKDDDGYYILKRADTLYPYKKFQENINDPVLCDKIKSFKLIYYDNDGKEYEKWDSESEEFDCNTPSAIGLKMETGDDKSYYFFETMIKLAMQRDKKK